MDLPLRIPNLALSKTTDFLPHPTAARARRLVHTCSCPAVSRRECCPCALRRTCRLSLFSSFAHAIPYTHNHSIAYHYTFADYYAFSDHYKYTFRQRYADHHPYTFYSTGDRGAIRK